MDYNQFSTLMKEEKLSKESIPILQEFVNEFPYFQSAHALLARAMYEHQHVRFDKHLKIAAAHSSDRTALYKLIHRKSAPAVHEPALDAANNNRDEERISAPTSTTSKASESTNIFSFPREDEDETQAVFHPADFITATDSPELSVPAEQQAAPETMNFVEGEELQVTPTASSGAPEYFEPVHSIDEEEEIIEDELPVADPHEIIRRRLNEILGLKGNENTAEKPVTNDPPETSIDKIEAATKEKQRSSENHTATTSNFSPAVHEAMEEVKAPEGITSDTNTSTDQLITPSIQKDISANEPIENSEELIAGEATASIDIVQKGELEYALEGPILQALEKLPVIERNTPAPESPVEHTDSTAVDFLGWLRLKTIPGYGEVEEVHAYPAAENQNGASTPPQSVPLISPKEKDETNDAVKADLIEKFIRTEPKIVASKAEFYSPVTQAKKSVTEDEDLVSETLARIYLLQGNFAKARNAYEKLGFLYPEKKAYFAALISEIDKEHSAPDNQDL